MIARSRWSLVSMLAESDPARVIGVAAAINGAVALGVITLAAWLTGRPMLFASLAPSAFILFSGPFSPAAAPRSVILGHAAGIACGWLAWSSVTGWTGRTVAIDRFGPEVAASVLIAFAMTAAALVRLRSNHAPACATALIIAMGTVTAPLDLLVMGLAVVMLSLCGTGLLRLGGVRVPLWEGEEASREARASVFARGAWRRSRVRRRARAACGSAGV
jgi:CBS-domain-containing membrane protein